MKCLHALPLGQCALCSGLVRAVEASHIPHKRSAKKEPLKRDQGIELRNDSPMMVELGLEPSDTIPLSIPKDGFFRCSFCLQEFPQERATEGRSQMRKLAKLHVGVPLPGEFDVEELHFASSVISCPECVLNIKPQLTGGTFVDGKRVGGSVLHSGIKFPETEG